jgi:hypothetical protein
MFRHLADDLEAIVDGGIALSCFKFTGLHKVIGHYVEYPSER